MRSISDMIDVSYVRQKEALGLGHAVLRAKELVGNEPFAVVLSDDVIDAETPCMRQLLDVYEYFGASVLALDGGAAENVSRPTALWMPSRLRTTAAATACSASETWSKSRKLPKRPRTWRLSAATC